MEIKGEYKMGEEWDDWYWFEDEENEEDNSEED